MNHNTRARIVAKLRSGVQPATLFERFQPSRRQARFEDQPVRRQEEAQTEARRPDIRDQPGRERRGQRGLPNEPSPLPSDSGGGGSNAHDEGQTHYCMPRYSSISRGLRDSIYNSGFGRQQTATDRSSERTDEIVRREINDAARAVANRSDAINVGKMMKISLPEYIGGESIDTFLKFL
jgi:hypothetical protein